MPHKGMMMSIHVNNIRYNISAKVFLSRTKAAAVKSVKLDLYELNPCACVTIHEWKEDGRSVIMSCAYNCLFLYPG